MKALSKYFILAALCTPFASHADDFTLVDKPTELKWQLSADSNRVYLRNLDSFKSQSSKSFKGCCYNYWIDLSQESGKALWSTVLAHIAQNKSFYISVKDADANGPISTVGNW